MSEVVTYHDPLLDLLKDPGLNSEKEKTQELVQYIEEIEDDQLKAWCIEAFEVLRDFERIELKTNGWKFATLDFNLNIESGGLALNDRDEEKRNFQRNLAKEVSSKCLDLHKLLVELGSEVDELSTFTRRLSPLQKISDPGTILTELNLRIIKLQNVLADKISIHYSRARLVNIGMSLEELVRASSGDSRNGGTSSSLTAETVANYRQFVNNLLQQLNECVAAGDTIGAMECIGIVNDVEKMFLSMKAQQEQETQRRIMYEKQQKEQVRREAQIRREVENKERKRRARRQMEEEDAAAAAAAAATAAEAVEAAETAAADSAYSTEAYDSEDFESASEDVIRDQVTSDEEDYDGEGADTFEDESEDSYDGGDTSTLLEVNVEERRRRRDDAGRRGRPMSMHLDDSMLHKAALSDKMPELMSAFAEAKAAESGLQKIISNNSPQKRAGSPIKDERSPLKRTMTPLKEGDLEGDLEAESTPQKRRPDKNGTKDELDDASAADSTAAVAAAGSTTSALPPLQQPSILRAFFQPQIRRPIVVPSQAVGQAVGVPTTPQAEKLRYQRMLDGRSVQEKLLRYEQEENIKDVDLPTNKLTAIEVGSGRVKSTVSEIEQQLPATNSPPSPSKNRTTATTAGPVSPSPKPQPLAYKALPSSGLSDIEDEID